MSDHRELIDATRRAHTKLGRWCRTCAAKWPCLPARLADAMEQSLATHEPCRCDPVGSGEENCNGGCELREQLAAAERRAAECRAWHCSGHRQCELERGHDGRHFAASLGNSFPGWDDSASVDVPGLLEALNDARTQVSAAERRAAALEAELAYTKSWANTCGGNLTHMDGVAAELRAQVAALEGRAAELENLLKISAAMYEHDIPALEQRATTAEADRDELTGHYEAVRDRVAALGIERAALVRDLAAANEKLAGLLVWALNERDEWWGKNADRHWQMNRVVIELQESAAAALAPQPAVEGPA